MRFTGLTRFPYRGPPFLRSGFSLVLRTKPCRERHLLRLTSTAVKKPRMRKRRITIQYDPVGAGLALPSFHTMDKSQGKGIKPGWTIGARVCYINLRRALNPTMEDVISMSKNKKKPV